MPSGIALDPAFQQKSGPTTSLAIHKKIMHGELDDLMDLQIQFRKQRSQQLQAIVKAEERHDEQIVRAYKRVKNGLKRSNVGDQSIPQNDDQNKRPSENSEHDLQRPYINFRVVVDHRTNWTSGFDSFRAKDCRTINKLAKAVKDSKLLYSDWF
jgi:hypothetical protein